MTSILNQRTPRKCSLEDTVSLIHQLINTNFFLRFPWEFNCVMPMHKFKYHSHITLTLLGFATCFYVILIGLKTDVLNVTSLKLIFIISQCTVTPRRQNMDSLVLKYLVKSVYVIPLFTGVSNCCCSFTVKNS